MMFGFMGPMMLGLGGLMATMFGGFLNLFFMPMQWMMSTWFNFPG